ncbi:hypothetical protein FE249_18630 (plasmid) [Acidiphilium multivorum]|uniref:hypothetical protein n=1 Tax=Acidiphilium multivorum TaxID=62140 RepID=UPI001F4BFC0F|nr:hypothetical protein [Acidiphilium multivorum]UNC16239.1 hypothetical protein FE249_18630 [Acidiphilium multivorum]
MKSEARGRAWRRHNRDRMICRAIGIVSREQPCGTPDEIRRSALLRADNLRDCTCSACGNPRRYWKSLTMAERRARSASRQNDTD